MANSPVAPPTLRVLFVAYFYPPTESTGVPGSMRTVKFIRSLSQVESFVLTTPPRVKPESDALRHLSLPVHREKILRVAGWDIFRMLLALKNILKPASSQTHSARPTGGAFKSGSEGQKRGAFQTLKDFIYDLCYFPDQAGPWILPAVVKGLRTVRRERLDVIFATGSPWSGLIVGCLISRLSGKPLVVDFRDPWTNNPFHKSKGQLLDSTSQRLERMVVRRASAISLNTVPLQEEFQQRYPEHQDKLFVMPNGFDPDDFVDLDAQASSTQHEDILLCHAGFLYGVRDPAVLLEAIRAANSNVPGGGKKIIFRQIGDVQLDYDLTDRFQDLVDDGALIVDSSMPYKDCLRALASADWVVNIQPGTRTQVPSKLYDYLALGRPIINITPKDGALGRLVSDRHLGALFGFEEKEALTEVLSAMLEKRSGDDFAGYSAAGDFSIKCISETLYRELLQVSAKNRE